MYYCFNHGHVDNQFCIELVLLCINKFNIIVSILYDYQIRESLGDTAVVIQCTFACDLKLSHIKGTTP